MQNTDPSRAEESHSTPDAKIKAAVFALWTQFQETMFSRLSLIEGASSDALKSSLNEGQRREARNAAHKLAGSLGTFGFGEGSKLAAELESILDGEASLTPMESGRLRDLAKMLRQEMERGPSPPA
jgi:HPt (histidine-containing phosphotransfer) domain-containing protein